MKQLLLFIYFIILDLNNLNSKKVDSQIIKYSPLSLKSVFNHMKFYSDNSSWFITYLKTHNHTFFIKFSHDMLKCAHL